MRISLYSALAVLSFGLIASQQPAAASTFWTCMSPEFGCGSAGSPSGSSHNYRSRERVYAGDTERRAYRGNSRQTADRAERRAAPVRVASINPRSEQRQVKSDATEAPKQVASVEPRNEGSSVATDVSVRKPQAPDAERTAAVRSAQSGMASYYGNEFGVADRFRGPFRRQRHDGRPSHASVRHQGSGDEQGERSFRRGHHQRSRPVRPRPHHRSFDRRRRRHRHDGCGSGARNRRGPGQQRLTSPIR